MPGIAPDPAETLDDIRGIITGFRQEAVQAVKDAGEAIARGIQSANGAATAEGRTIFLAPNSPTVLLTYDRARVRALLRASAPDVYIGDLSQLTGGYGYPLPTEAGDEIKSIDQVYVVYAPTTAPVENVRVHIWAERNVSQ